VLQALICASLSSSLLRTSSSNSEAVSLQSETPIGLPRPDATVLGNYISALTVFSKVSGLDKFWTHVRTYAATLKDPFERQRAQEFMGMLGYVPDRDLYKFMRDQLESDEEGKVAKFGSSFELSNVGVVEREEQQGRGGNKEFEVVNAWFGQAPLACLSALEISALSYTKHGELALHVGWVDGVLKEELVDAFVLHLERGVKRLVEGQVTEETTMAEIVE
jgi:hypothetical protein